MEKRKQRRQRRQKGFTIIELVVVAVIIGLLAAFVVPNIGKKFGKAKANIAKGKIAIIESALVEFQIDCGRFPTDTENLDALLVAPTDLEEKWDGPYCKESDLIDPWENPYQYVAEGVINPNSFDIICLGADGAEGGEGENEDLYNN